MDFNEICPIEGWVYRKANAISLAKRKSVEGIGTNDAPFVINQNGKDHPIYKMWNSMLRRCYSASRKQRQPYYEDATCEEEWHRFMSFFHWVLNQENWQGLSLDKDIKVPGNKVYGPDACLLVTPELNSAVQEHSKHNNGLPGRMRIKRGKYGSKSYGWFDTQEEALNKYLFLRSHTIFGHALNQPNTNAMEAAIKLAHSYARQVPAGVNPAADLYRENFLTGTG